MKQALPFYLSFMNDLVPERAPFAATWTLAVEEKFYLVWPLLFFVLFRQKRWREYVILVLYAAIVVLPFFMWRSYYGLLNGCSLAVLLNLEFLPRLKLWVAKLSPALIVLLILLCMGLVDYNGRFVFAFSILIVLLVANLTLRPSRTKEILSSAPFVWLGQRSYAMYLVHGLVLDVVFHFVPPSTMIRQIGIILIGGAVSALIADGLRRWVEEPCRQYGKRVLARRRAEPVAG